LRAQLGLLQPPPDMRRTRQPLAGHHWHIPAAAVERLPACGLASCSSCKKLPHDFIRRQLQAAPTPLVSIFHTASNVFQAAVSYHQLTLAASLGSMCSSFALVAPPLRQSTRDAAYPADPSAVDAWLQSLAEQPDSVSFHSKCGPSARTQGQTSAASYEAPGGAWIMELMLRAGMYAPMETRLFHHIISVRFLSVLLCFVMPALRCFTRAQRGFASGHSPLIVDVGANVRCAFNVCAFMQRAAIVLAFLKPLECVALSPLRKVGYFSLLALSLGCRVMAFEPSAHMMPCAPYPCLLPVLLLDCKSLL
jgi:hypothetical protein